MTIVGVETAVESAEPIDFYQITVGSRVYWLTSADKDTTFNSQVYVSTAIQRTPAKVSASNSDGSITIQIPQDHALSALFYGVPPGQKGTINIRRTHKSLLTGGVYEFAFTGYLSNVKFEGDLFTAIRWASPAEFLGRNAPRFKYIGLCNHVLGDAWCGKDLEALKLTASVTALPAADIITVPGSSGLGADYLEGGFVSFTSPGGPDYRLILSQSGNDLRLLAPFMDSVLGQLVSVYPGCKHRPVQDCQGKFNNLPQFGGFPHIPVINPFQTRIG